MKESSLLQCKICDNTERNTLYKVKEMMLGIRDTHNYFECSDCGCLQIVEVPSNIQEYYPSDDYYSYNVIKPITGLKGQLIRKRDEFAATGKGLLGKIMQHIQPHDKLPSLQHANVNLDSKILDVGCGAGHLLHSMKEAGFKNILGIDPYNTEDIEYDNGLTIIKNSIHDLPKNSHGSMSESTDDGWDLIMFNHSYEHVLDQVEVLEKTWELLKPGGICMLRIPTVTSWAWRHYGEDWVQLDAPRHFFLHSIKTGSSSKKPKVLAIALPIKTIWVDSIANVSQISRSGRMVKNHADKVITQWKPLSDDETVFYKGSIL